jgi:hypothetical protein
MKKILLVAVLGIVGVMAGSSFAAAPLDVQVDVNAAVTQKCVVTSNGTLDITIDPASAAATQAFTAVEPSAKCTKTKASTTAAVAATSLNSFKLKGAGLTDIPYTFTYNSTVTGNGFGSAADVDFGIGGTVAQADALVAEYGSYTDTVTMTLTY